MNHDVSHCADYKKSKCPKSCYRAQVTEDLKSHPDLYWMPMSWAHFEGTQYCEKQKGKENV